jgi:hypothetical protein
MEAEPTEFMQNEADEFQQAWMRQTVMADKDRIRDQRMIMVFTFVITLCAIVLGLQSAFTCTCTLNFLSILTNLLSEKCHLLLL